MFPKKDQAVILDSLENVQIKDYAQALGKIVDPSQIRFLSRISNNRVCVYLSSKSVADDIVENKQFITIQNQRLPIRPLINRNKRIIISNVCPIIPHSEIEKRLQEMQITPMSPISFLRAGINENGYNHILSFRRQLYVTPEDFNRLPEKVSIDFDETTYWIYFSSDTMTCFICKNDGHVASKCPENNEASSRNNMETQNTDTLIPKRPHPPTESSTTKECMESEIINEETALSIDNSGDDLDNVSLSSSDEVYKTASGKKLKRTPHSDLDSIKWDQIDDFIATSSKNYPLSGKEVKEYLEDTYGVKNIKDITFRYTEEIDTLIELLTDLIPNISYRSVKNRLSRIVSKLKIITRKAKVKCTEEASVNPTV